MFRAFKERRPWAAVLIELVLSPFVAMLYLNRGKLALLYLAADFSISVLVLAAIPFREGHSPEPFIWLARTPLLLFGAVHSYILSTKWDGASRRHWYSRWYAIIGILVIFPVSALLIRTFLFQPFDAPSTSMSPSVNEGDYFWVSKFAYDWSEPRRGDVVVFRASHLDGAPYVKRIVGLPGERVQMRAGILYINGTPAPQRRMADFLEECGSGSTCHIPQFAETLPGGRTDVILDRTTSGAEDDTPEFVVPTGSYFVLGDNRDNSMDSRNDLGFIRREDILGRASRKFVSGGRWTWNAIN